MDQFAVDALVAGLRSADTPDEVWERLDLATRGWWQAWQARSLVGAALYRVGELGEAPWVIETPMAEVVVTVSGGLSSPVISRLTAEITSALARTARLDQERMLERYAPRMLTEMLRQARVNVAFLDRTHRYVIVNERMASWHGVPVEDHVGRPLRAVIGEVAEAAEPVIDEVFATGEERGPTWFTGALPGRPVRNYEARYFPVFDDGEVVLVGCVVREHLAIETAPGQELRDALEGLRASGADVTELESALERIGLTGRSCVAHTVLLHAGALFLHRHDRGAVLRWELANGASLVGVNGVVLGEVFASALAAVAARGVVVVRSTRIGSELVIVIRGPHGAPVGVTLEGAAAFRDAGGVVQADGEVVLRAPLGEGPRIGESWRHDHT